MPRDKAKKQEYDRRYRLANRAKRDASVEKYYLANPEKKRLKDRRVHLKTKYGLSVEDYENLFNEQAGTCAICFQPPLEGQLLCVDHSHETGQVRGLLCRKCNTGIGMLEDDPTRLSSAISYLERAL